MDIYHLTFLHVVGINLILAAIILPKKSHLGKTELIKILSDFRSNLSGMRQGWASWAPGVSVTASACLSLLPVL